MPRPVRLVPHLSVDELERRFQKCDDAVEKTHWQVILLVAKGRRTAEVAEICGYKPDWVRRLIHRFNEQGPEALRDKRENNGAASLLSEEQMAELAHAVLNEAPPGGGLWTGPKVAQWMGAKLSRHVNPQTAWNYFKYLGMSKQTPRPRHAKASPEAQARFKKNFEADWR